ncbi:helix-turn-helix domain-containing protein, partial [Streptomyces sp. SID2999]|uniref:helix-turn-helix domain-containing protein n=1 Tax=Streptomyces sp. SID2999 TaxID=2690258 RepID=UPI0013698EFB|nr:helix-turn-helix domain-containing protein [Streptomyces sp. SID2999]
MTGFHAIDALLAGARTPAVLPPAGQRRALRQALHLTRAQVAQALGVSPSTVGGWEAGRDPGGELREKYAYFLAGAQEKLRTQHEDEPRLEAVPAAEPAAADGSTRPASRPCVLCGAPATDEVEGYPQHLHPDDCTHPTPTPASQPEAAAPGPQAPAPLPAAPLQPEAVPRPGAALVPGAEAA